MIELNIPGREKLIIKNLILDLNGTISLHGKIIEGVAKRLRTLNKQLDISVITADTRGRAEQALEELRAETADGEKPFSIRLHKIERGAENIQKHKLVQGLGSLETVSIGNGSNDAHMLKESAIGICVVGREGAAVESVMNADLAVSHINDALDLLLMPQRLVATLRK